MRLLISVFVILSTIYNFPQSIMENSSSDIYDFLESMSYKGLIEFHSGLKPVSRKELAAFIYQIESQITSLTYTERDLLQRFRIEFEPELRTLSNDAYEPKVNFF